MARDTPEQTTAIERLRVEIDQSLSTARSAASKLHRPLDETEIFPSIKLSLADWRAIRCELFGDVGSA